MSTKIVAAPSEDNPEIPDDAGKLKEVAETECPWCGRDGNTIHEYNVCDGCGCWFRVEA